MRVLGTELERQQLDRESVARLTNQVLRPEATYERVVTELLARDRIELLSSHEHVLADEIRQQDLAVVPPGELEWQVLQVGLWGCQMLQFKPLTHRLVLHQA